MIEQRGSRRQGEVETLRARIAELEAEHAALAARANEAVAAAQGQTYWLERWQIDIDGLAAKPAGARLLRLLRRIAPSR